MSTLKDYLTLCRVSNLPTVWTNVLAAGLLAGGPFMPAPFFMLALALSCFYLAGMSLNEVFSLYGQPGFRRLEKRCLENFIEQHERAVISVGGGIVSEPATFNLLLMNCFTVWLKATPEEHMSRVLAQGDLRPMEGNSEAMDDMRRILAAREALYSKADFTLETTGQHPGSSLKLLRGALAMTARDNQRRKAVEQDRPAPGE